MGLHSTGTSRDVLGILGYLVFRDLWAPTVLEIPGHPGNPWIVSIQGSVPPQCSDFPGCPRNPGILSIQGSMGLHSAETSRDVLGIPGYLVFTNLWASTVLRLPGMSRESWDT